MCINKPYILICVTCASLLAMKASVFDRMKTVVHTHPVVPVRDEDH